MTSGFILLKYTPRFWRTARQPPKPVQSRDPTNLCPFWAQPVPHPGRHCSSHHLQRPLIQFNIQPPHGSRQQRARAARGLRGAGNWGKACFSNPVFGFIHSRCARTIAQGSKYSSTIQSSRNSTHSVFNICGFIKPQIHCESTERVTKHHSRMLFFVFTFPLQVLRIFAWNL